MRAGPGANNGSQDPRRGACLTCCRRRDTTRLEGQPIRAQPAESSAPGTQSKDSGSDLVMALTSEWLKPSASAWATLAFLLRRRRL